MPVYIIADEWRKKDTNGFFNLPGIGPIDFINLIANAKHIVTNSFHGAVFSIIFKKQFTVIPYEGTENRIYALLKLLNLEEAIYDNDIDCRVDFSKIEKILQYERDKAKKFLQKAIGDV